MFRRPAVKWYRLEAQQDLNGVLSEQSKHGQSDSRDLVNIRVIPLFPHCDNRHVVCLLRSQTAEINGWPTFPQLSHTAHVHVAESDVSR
jgi:hypothetical protein